MNAGKTADQLAADIQLPPEYAGLPYLAEHYGCVEWTVRSIYSAYLGWFDGNPTHFAPPVPRRTFTKDDCVNRRHADCFGRGQNQPFPTKNTNGVWNYAIYFYPMEIQQKRKYCI